MIDFAVWKLRDESMQEVVAFLRGGGTLMAFAAQRGFNENAVRGWIRHSKERQAVYDTVKVRQGRPTKKDAAGAIAAQLVYRQGAVQPMAAFLGVSRGTLWNWGVRRTARGVD